MRRAGAVLILNAGLASPSAAHVWNVPNEVPTIQGALALAASYGDVITIEPGTYHEALVLPQKVVTIEGAGAAVTIIDATGLGTSVIRMPLFAGGGGHLTLRGVTLTGGNGTPLTPSGELRGGAVYAGAGSQVLQDCIIRDNGVAGPGSAGGGVWAGFDNGQGGFAIGFMTLYNCELAFNAAGGNGGAAAGNITLFDSRVHDNVAEGQGGALYGITAAVDCLIEGNHAPVGGGAALNAEGFSHCEFRANHADVGGGLWDDDALGLELGDNRFEDNVAEAFGGGVALLSTGATSSGITLDRGLFVGNSAPAGDGAYLDVGTLAVPLGTIEARSCTFLGDQLLSAGSDDLLVVRNGIFRGHPQPIAAAMEQVTYSDVEGGFPGTGNIDEDPKFVDEPGGDFALQPGSPCINTGDPSSPLDDDGSVADMGAIAFQGWLDLGGAIAGLGAPHIVGKGALVRDEIVTLKLTSGPPAKMTTLIVGLEPLGTPFKGGTLWPNPDIVVAGLPTDIVGSWTLGMVWPAGLPHGWTIVVQVWFPSAFAPFGYAASNGLLGTVP